MGWWEGRGEMEMWMEGLVRERWGRRGEERKELWCVSQGVGRGLEGGWGREREGKKEGDVLHSAGTAPVIAVVEVETFALEDECAEAILDGRMVSVLGASYGMRLIVEGGVGGRGRDILWRSR